MIDDQIKLLAFQQSLEQDVGSGSGSGPQQTEASGRGFVGLSVNATVRACIVHGQAKKADKLKSDFKIPDKRCVSSSHGVRPWSSSLLSCPARKTKLTTTNDDDDNLRLGIAGFGWLHGRFWHVKLRALTSLRDWAALEQFARSRKSPIGYEPFVEHLVATGNHRQAVGFVGRCEQRNKVELFVKCGEWGLAGSECVRRGERGKLL